MKKFLMAMTAVICALSANAQMLYPQPDLLKDKLQGPVKKVSTYTLFKKDYYTEDEYNEYKKKGLPLPEYDRIFDSTKKYNTDGYYAEVVEDFLDDLYTTVYDYKDGRQVSQKAFKNGNLNTVYRFEYDSDGMPVGSKKSEVKGEDEVLLFTETYKIEDAGDAIVEHVYKLSTDGSWEDGEMRFSKKTHNPISMDVTYSNGREQHIILQEDQPWIPISLYMKSGNIETKYTRISDIMGKSEIKENGKVKNTKIITYDQYFNPLVEVEGNSTVTYQYEYDSHGNWIRRVKEPGGLFGPSITEREIEYYDTDF